MKISKKLKAAMKAYYQNRKAAREGKPWDKQADLKAIEAALPQNCVYFEACAGTFWITWRRPRIQTVHSESNYWCNKVLSRYNRKEKKFIKIPGVWA